MSTPFDCRKLYEFSSKRITVQRRKCCRKGAQTHARTINSTKELLHYYPKCVMSLKPTTGFKWIEISFNFCTKFIRLNVCLTRTELKSI